MQERQHFRLKIVAQMLGLSYSSLARYCRDGTCRCSVTPGGGAYVMNQEQIDELITQMEEAAHLEDDEEAEP